MHQHESNLKAQQARLTELIIVFIFYINHQIKKLH